ncbi:MAG: S49 family peptidase [Pseudomonadota bacterium]
MWPMKSKPVVPVLRLQGVIGRSSAFQSALSLATVAGPIERAFSMSKLPSVAVLVNSPGGSPVQSNLIFKRIRQLADEKKKRVYVFCEDVAASGGYYIAVAGDEIYADPSSIIGSIGVIAASFGFVEAIDKIGVERRVYTAGRSKSTLDPFKPEKAEDVERITAIQREIHDTFIGVVKSRRGSKLDAAGDDLFTGAFWAGPTAMELGLIDGIADVREKMRELHGDSVQLRLVPGAKRGLLSRFSRPPSVAFANALGDPSTLAHGLADGTFSAIEQRALWGRYGL